MYPRNLLIHDTHDMWQSGDAYSRQTIEQSYIFFFQAEDGIRDER